MLNTISINHIVTSQTCGQARRLLLEKDFDLVVINSPLRDETGRAPRYIASREPARLSLLKSEHFEEVSATAGKTGF